MIELSYLSYVPDPFAVENSQYFISNPQGIKTALSPGDLSSYSLPIITYELALLVDDLRRSGFAPPRVIFDIGDAVRLAVGRSKDDGGEKLWNVWRELKPRFDERDDADTFEMVVAARAKRPDTKELTRLLEAALDALQRLWADLAARLAALDELGRLTQVEWPLQSLFAYRQYRGVRVDAHRAGELLARISAEKYAAYREVAVILGTSPTGINFWNIHQYLERTDVAYLADLDAGGRVQDAFELAASHSPFAANFLAFFKATRDEAVVRRALGGEERLYPIFSVLGTVSGRILVSDPYLQQLRRAYRSLISAEPNTKLIYLDYAQFEPGVLAGVAGDETLIGAYNSGDLYSSLAIVLFGHAYARPSAKRVFLAFLYGMTAGRIAVLLSGADGSQADRDIYAAKISSFFQAYPGLESFRSIQQKRLLKDGFVSSLDGNRRVRTGKGELSPKEKRWAVNQPIQSTASLIFKEALLSISREFGEESIILPVHDAVLLQLGDNDKFESNVAGAIELMIQAFNRRIPTVKCRVTSGAFAE